MNILSVVIHALKAAVDKHGLDASVTVDKLVSQIEQLQLTKTIDVSFLKANYELGQFLSFIEQADTATTIDEFVAALAKTFTEDLALADAVTFDVIKPLADHGVTSDLTVLDLAKELSEAASSSDASVISFVKALADSGGVSQQFAQLLSKPISDSYTTADTYSAFFGKQVSDSGALSDVDIISVTKVLADVSLTTDSNYFDIVKALSDTLYATDDLDGEASILDDQTIQFSKLRSELASTSDAVVLLISFVRAFSDTVGTTEALTFDAAKPLTNLSSALDLAALAFTTARADSGSASDAVVLLISFVRTFSDTVGTAEDLTFDTAKQLTNLPSASDLAALAFTTARSDSGSVSDNTLNLVGKNISDSGLLSEAGNYRGQGYCSFDYFAEDFVGYSGSF